MRLAFSPSQPSQPGWLLLRGATISLWHSLASCPQMAAVKLPLQQLAPSLGPAVSARFLVPGFQNPESPRSERKAWHADERKRNSISSSQLHCVLFISSGNAGERTLGLMHAKKPHPQPSSYFLFQDRILQSHPGWPQSHSAAQASLTPATPCLSLLSPCNDRSTCCQAQFLILLPPLLSNLNT